MEIETYEIEEQVGVVGGTTPEIEEKALELIESLELEGQRELTSTPDESGETVRIPYPVMDMHEKRVYGTLYPNHDALAEYKAGIIPLRVLQVAEHGKTIFPHLYVWHSKVYDPDPLLVATMSDSFDPPVYLLARWGDALRPFKDLAKLARVTLLEKWTMKIKKKVTECNTFEAGIDVHIDEYISGDGYVCTPF